MADAAFDSAAFDSRAYRDTMGQFCTGVAIVTGNEDGTLVGFAAQSFVSLSLGPAADRGLPGQDKHELAADSFSRLFRGQRAGR